MPSFRGTPLAPGIAIAAAALVTEEYGVPTLSATRRLAVAARLRRLGIENPEDEHVILIGQIVPPSMLPSPLPGLTVVGAAMGNAPASPFPVPCVAGLGDDFAAQVEDGDICIVDADRGRVFVNPDAQTLSLYQAPRRAPRRVFLDPVHLPARTQNGTTVQVYAQVLDNADVERAIDNGADALYLPEQNAFAGEQLPSAGEQFLALRDLLRLAAGKPVWVDAPPECVALSALGRAAAFGPLHFVVHTADAVDVMRSELRELADEWDGDDAPFGDVGVEPALPGVLCIGAAWESELTQAVSSHADAVIVDAFAVSAAKAHVQTL